MTKTALVKQVQGLTFAGKAESNHWVMMDGPKDFGGSEAGTRAKELVLLALAGCAGSDVVSILHKKRVKVDTLEIRVTAEQAETHPQVFTAIHLEFVLTGDTIRLADVERAIELSETKYCSVHAMLNGTVEMTHSVRLEAAAAVELAVSH